MQHNRKIIYLAGFLFSLPVALMSYINSSFLAGFVNEKFVGIIYACGSIVSVLALLLVPKIWRIVGGYRFLIGVIALDALSILLFAFSKNALTAVVLFIIGFTLNILVFFSLDEILKIFSNDSGTGKIRGIYLTFCSLAWVMGQLATGTILGGFSFKEIYIVSFILAVSFLLMSYLDFKKIPDPKYDRAKGVRYIKEFFKNKNLSRAYSISLLLQFFFCWMVIYTPIYLSLHLGFSWSQIGIIFAIMLLPFCIVPFHLGKYGDKIGERKMLMWGFAITSFFTCSLFFIQQKEIWIWALLLFSTRVGAATIEVMSDAYFFKHIKSENDEFVGVYRSASPVAYIIGPLVASIIFILVPSFNFIYVILGAIMLFGVYLSSTIRKSDI